MPSILDRLQTAATGVGTDALVQVLASLVIFAAVLAVARLIRAGLGRDPAWAFVRGLVQVVAIGFLLAAILSLHAAWSALVLLAMATVAAGITRRRAEGEPRAYVIALASISLGTVLTVVAMLAMGTLDPTIQDLVPVGSIIVANCMRTGSLVFERYRRERDALGAADAVAPSVRASLIPAIDGMRSLGFVWIPGIMTGLILGGTPPVEAAFLQFVVIAMGFVSAAITSMTATALMARAQREEPPAPPTPPAVPT